jgi:hypothetical protein
LTYPDSTGKIRIPEGETCKDLKNAADPLEYGAAMHMSHRSAPVAAAIPALLALIIGVVIGTTSQAQQSQQPAPAAQEGRQAPPPGDLGLKVTLEPRAIELLKAMSSRLAEAKTLSFTVVAAYESPARTGQPLVYTVRLVWCMDAGVARARRIG